MSAQASHTLASAIGTYMDTAPFWVAAREQRLLLQYCTQSNRYQSFPRPGSVFTGTRQLQWREASGKGRLASWTVNRIPDHGAPDTAPRIHALVDLAEGVRLLSWLVNCDAASLRSGILLKVHWVELDKGIQWPAFEPDSNDQPASVRSALLHSLGGNPCGIPTATQAEHRRRFSPNWSKRWPA